jgi:hypothetical protein
MGGTHLDLGADNRALHGRWDRIAWACTLAGLALLALVVAGEWNAARNTQSPVFANPRIAITDTPNTAQPSTVVAAR